MTQLLENDVTGFIGIQKYKCTINWRNGQLIMDEPTKIEGRDLGPDPFSTLLAALAGCTLSTLRMYIDRKSWDIPKVKISLNLYQNNESNFETIITRDISFSSQIDQEIKKRLSTIAEKCPVSKILKNTITISTTI